MTYFLFLETIVPAKILAPVSTGLVILAAALGLATGMPMWTVIALPLLLGVVASSIALLAFGHIPVATCPSVVPAAAARTPAWKIVTSIVLSLVLPPIAFALAWDFLDWPLYLLRGAFESALLVVHTVILCIAVLVSGHWLVKIPAILLIWALTADLVASAFAYGIARVS